MTNDDPYVNINNRKQKTLVHKAGSRPARVTDAAHEATIKLCEYYAKELGLTSVSRTDAISRAVLEAVKRRQTKSVAA